MMDRFTRLLKDQRGYSVIELLSILMIMGVLTSLVVFNSNGRDTKQQVRDAASNYVTAAKQAESMASSSQAVLNASTGQQESRQAYGVCLRSEGATTPCTVIPTQPITKYEVYARRGTRCPDPAVPCNGWPSPEAAGIDVVKTYTLPKKAAFVQSAAQTFVDYQPPGPSMEVHETYNGAPVPATEVQLIVIDDVARTCAPAGVFCNTVAIRANAGVVYVK